MLDFLSVRGLLIAVVISLTVCSIASADQERAWQALHDLEIAEAKELFQQELKKSPKDLSVMRGLLLAAYFDLDYETQVEMVEAMVKAHPDDPYLVPVFEHVADKLTGWGYQPGRSCPPPVFTPCSNWNRRANTTSRSVKGSPATW